MMSHTEQAERIKTLAASLRADEAERDRLKKLSDERLAELHRAAREFTGRRELRDRAA
jgi:hypothetical protein